MNVDIEALWCPYKTWGLQQATFNARKEHTLLMPNDGERKLSCYKQLHQNMEMSMHNPNAIKQLINHQSGPLQLLRILHGFEIISFSFKDF